MTLDMGFKALVQSKSEYPHGVGSDINSYFTKGPDIRRAESINCVCVGGCGVGGVCMCVF